MKFVLMLTFALHPTSYSEIDANKDVNNLVFKGDLIEGLEQCQRVSDSLNKQLNLTLPSDPSEKVKGGALLTTSCVEVSYFVKHFGTMNIRNNQE